MLKGKPTTATTKTSSSIDSVVCSWITDPGKVEKEQQGSCSHRRCEVKGGKKRREDNKGRVRSDGPP